MVVESTMEQPEMPVGVGVDSRSRRNWWSGHRSATATDVPRRVLAGRPATDGIPRRALAADD